MRLTNGFSGYLVVVPVQSGRALFVVRTKTTVDPTLQAARLRTLLRDPVAACAGEHPMIYVVQEGRIVRALLRVNSSGFEQEFGVDREFRLPGEVPPPVGLALHTGLGDLPALYAVNGTDAVYRLREDGVPDQRIQVEPE